MAFEHLPHERIQELYDAFLHLPVTYDGFLRATLFTSIAPAFKNLLPLIGAPSPQLLFDLGQLNAMERLSDGSVPFVIWLRNAALIGKGTDAAKVFLKAASDIETRAAGAPRVDVSALPEVQEVVVHENDMVSYSFMQAGVEAGRAVAKLMVPRHEGGQPFGNPPKIFLGTGWLLSSALLVTNHHVINARRKEEPPASPQDFQLQGLAATVKFDYDGDDEQGVDFGVAAIEGWDKALDYAILRLSADTGRRPLPVIAAPLMQQGTDHIPVNVVQHPQGMSKKYGIRNNLVSATTATDVRYFTDTDGGSSGAPVFDDSWKVVALHRGATFVEGVTFQGRSTAYVNVGTQARAIVANIQQRYPALAQELQL